MASVFAALSLVWILALAAAQDECQAPCSATSCNCNGNDYDFSVIQGVNTPWLEIKLQQGSSYFWYYLQLVNGGLPSSNLPHCDWADPSASQGNVAGQAADPTQPKSCVALGMNSNPTPVWSINSQQNPQVVSITFTDGAPVGVKLRQTVLWVTCDPTQTGGVTEFTVDENPLLTYNFRLNHISACANAPPPVTTTAAPGPGSGCSNPCSAESCVCNGRQYDLSKFNNGSSDIFEYQDGEESIFLFQLTGNGLPTNITDICNWENQDYSEYNVAGLRLADSTTCVSLGSVSNATWAIDVSSQPQRLTLAFTEGQPIPFAVEFVTRMSTVVVIECCSDCPATVLASAYAVPYKSVVNYMFYSPLACP